ARAAARTLAGFWSALPQRGARHRSCAPPPGAPCRVTLCHLQHASPDARPGPEQIGGVSAGSGVPPWSRDGGIRDVRSRRGPAASWRSGQLSLSRLNHGQPRIQAHSEIVQGTAELHHQVTNTLLPQADPVFDDAAALDAAVDMLDPEPPL